MTCRLVHLHTLTHADLRLTRSAIGPSRFSAKGAFADGLHIESELGSLPLFALMGEAGMGFRQILASLTTAPAERFGESVGLGRIAPGLIANMVILDKDPSKDVRAFAAVRYTIRDGRVIYEAKATRSPSR